MVGWDGFGGLLLLGGELLVYGGRFLVFFAGFRGEDGLGEGDCGF